MWVLAVVLMGFDVFLAFFCDQYLCTCAMNMAKMCDCLNVGLKNVRLHFCPFCTNYSTTCLWVWSCASKNVTYIFGDFPQKCNITFLRLSSAKNVSYI